jgi:Fe2+ transport system protein FeoA
MTLAEADVGATVKIVSRRKNTAAHSGLTGMGLQIGERVVVVRTAPFQGPVLVEIPASNVHLALGREVAESLIVEPTEAHAS